MSTASGNGQQDWLGDETKSWLKGYQQIESVTNEPALEWAVREAQKNFWVDRLESTVEAHTLPVAHVREKTGIPGISSRTAYLCRDKVAMKEVLRKAGVPTAASGGVTSVAEAKAFAAEVGYPVILKPRDAAGAAGTYRAGNDAELVAACRDCGVADGAPAAIEEFVEGHEGFYDTLTVEGRVHHDFISHYYPNVLEAMRTRWISPQIVSTNEVGADRYREVREMGKTVIEALGITTAATHMEWFFGPKGLKFSEIGCRPPGVGQWDSYCAGNEFDLYREWALAVCHYKTDIRPSRRYACGIVALQARPRRADRGLRGDGAHIRQIWRSCRRPALPRAGAGDARGRGGLYGQCLDAGAARKLRQPARHPQRDRRDHQGPCKLGSRLRPRTPPPPGSSARAWAA